MVDPPFAVKCPICLAQHKLEVTNWSKVTCSACGFFGTGYDLYAKVRDIPLASAVSDLVLVGASTTLEAGDERKLFDQHEFRELWKVWSGRIADGPSSVRAILQANGIPCHDQDLKALVPHIGCVQKQDIEDYIPKGSGIKTRMGNWMWIAIPTFSDCRFTGLHLINQTDCFWMSLFDSQDDKDFGLGFGLIPNKSHSQILVVSDAVMALDLQLRSLAEQQKTLPVVIGQHGPINPSADVCPGGLVFWPTEDSVETHALALRTFRASVVPFKTYSEFLETKGGLSFVIENLLHKAKTPATSLIRYLLSKSETDARSALAAAQLTDAEREQLLLVTSGDEGRYLADLLRDAKAQTVVSWNKYKIREEPNGWYSGQTIMSQAVLRIETLQPDGAGDATANGWIRCKQHRIPFTEKLSVLRKRTGKWLHDFVLNKLGMSIIVNNTVSAHLVDIALLFHEPKSKAATTDWSGGDCLRFPLFAIDARGIHPGRFDVPGELMQVPQPLTPVEQSSLTDSGYCELVLALLGNLVRLVRGMSPLGLVAMNREFMVRRVGSALQLPDLIAYGDRVTGNLPHTCLLDQALMGEMFEKPAPNVVTSVGHASYSILGLRRDWLRLEQDAPKEYRGLRLCLLALPKALANNVQPETPTFYRDLAASTRSYLSDSRVDSRLHRIAAVMDTGAVARQGILAQRLVDLVWRGISDGLVTTKEEDNYIVLDWKEVQNAYRKSIVQLPDIKDVQELLAESDYLIQAKAGVFRLNKGLWELHGHLV